jgi:hypothetical protein
VLCFTIPTSHTAKTVQLLSITALGAPLTLITTSKHAIRHNGSLQAQDHGVRRCCHGCRTSHLEAISLTVFSRYVSSAPSTFLPTNMHKSPFSSSSGKIFALQATSLPSHNQKRGFAYGLLDVLNPHFQTSLNITAGRASGLSAAYFGAYFLCPPTISGWILRKWGFRVTFMSGLAILSVGCLLMWCVDSFHALFIKRTISHIDLNVPGPAE